MLGLVTDSLPVQDEGAVMEIVRRAVDGGINYLDLGLPYDIAWQEPRARLVGRALRDGYRSKVKLATGLPALLINSTNDLQSYLDNLTGWLQTDRIDFFLFGGLDRYTWPRLQSLDVLTWAETAVAGGRIGGIGFAFHDIFQYLREIIAAYDKWAVVRLQYSYMDIDHHPGTAGIGYAAEKGLAVVVAEPLKGGRLVRQLPEPVVRLWAEATNRTPASLALRWAWDHPGLSTVVTGISNLKELEDNLALAGHAAAGSVSINEEILLGRLRDAYRKLRPVPCTACRGCMPCPLGIDAPRVFELFNDSVMYQDVEMMRTIYINERHRVEDCDECGACTLACGFKIDLPGFLKQAQTLLKGQK